MVVLQFFLTANGVVVVRTTLVEPTVNQVCTKKTITHLISP